MGEITIHLPPDLEESIEKFVSQGIYKSRDDAIIALIRVGISALKKREAVSPKSSKNTDRIL